MDRCIAKIAGTTAFYLKGSQCGCSATSSGACSVTSSSAYTSYEIHSPGKSCTLYYPCLSTIGAHHGTPYSKGLVMRKHSQKKMKRAESPQTPITLLITPIASTHTMHTYIHPCIVGTEYVQEPHPQSDIHPIPYTHISSHHISTPIRLQLRKRS